MESLTDTHSNRVDGHRISHSFSEVFSRAMREVTGLDVAHRQTSSGLVRLGCQCQTSELLGMA
ncbi:hypothetical protein PpBr36_08795 [Pyricularia pennisetigena]|uniref:hypothetical protein n=1 Tax=Pyricularia pennisetigena TaxID=1578925 RepID=UPI001153CBDC|nr:hypothetical protein PpBr36_08795 [Pyricularia pennisetigena]TLS24387.1 hypothetical protein PpBr36_08795 [Pyricularia pennisetigena]